MQRANLPSNKVSRSTRPLSSFVQEKKVSSNNGSPAARLSSILVFLKMFVLFAIIVLAATMLATGQTQPNLENGFKHYGSYDFHGIDTVNTMNGNLMLHTSLLPDYPQRGKLAPHYNLYVTS